jgi:hypothetical protein
MATKALATTAKPARAKRTTSSEVTAVSYAIDDIPTSQQVLDAIETDSKLYFDGDESTTSILPGILGAAEKPIDVFGSGELEKVEDHFGETLNILSLDGVRNSDFEGGLGVYLIVTASTIDGEIIRLGVGNTDAVAKLVKLNEMGAFPWAVSFDLSTKATKRGFFPINLNSRQPQAKTDLRAGEKSF